MYPPFIRITDFPFVKQGIRTGPANAILSWKLKLLSARTRSLQFNVLRNPDCKVSKHFESVLLTVPWSGDAIKFFKHIEVTGTKVLHI